MSEGEFAITTVLNGLTEEDQNTHNTSSSQLRKWLIKFKQTVLNALLLGLELYALSVLTMELPLDAGDVLIAIIVGTQYSTQKLQ